MNKKSIKMLGVLTLMSSAAFAAQENTVTFQNHLRLGYDDNIYNSSDEEGSAYLTDIVNLTVRRSFSTRSDALLYWEPEFRYRFDADPEIVSYQNLYGRFNHAISERVFVTVSDSFIYRDKEGQIGTGVDDTDQSYLQNELSGAVNLTLDEVSYLTLGAGYSFRVWDDEDYGKWDSSTLNSGNDYSIVDLNASYNRELVADTTDGMVGVNYSMVDYDGSRGGYDNVVAYMGLDHYFTPTVKGYGRLGYSFTTVEANDGDKSDSSTPYLEAGLEAKPSDNTEVTGTIGYSTYRAENSLYNAQDQFKFGVAVRHDLTEKINIAASWNYIFSVYDSAYEMDSSASLADEDDIYWTAGLRCSYEINRNNFAEVGYQYRNREWSGDGDSDYEGNRFDVAWRLRL